MSYAAAWAIAVGVGVVVSESQVHTAAWTCCCCVAMRVPAATGGRERVQTETLKGCGHAQAQRVGRVAQARMVV